MSKFGSGDGSIPQKLKKRIEGWQNSVPKSQHEMYGPYNHLLYTQFSSRRFMVKPQPRLRAPVDDYENALLMSYGLTGPLPDDAEEAQQVQDLRDLVAARELSVDSTIPGYVQTSATQVKKKYPDFGVCEYATEPLMGDEKDRFVVILEIASDPTRKSNSEEANEKRLRKAKSKLCQQLLRYMRGLGDNGQRWTGNVLGIVAIDLEVAFLQPRKTARLVGRRTQ